MNYSTTLKENPGLFRLSRKETKLSDAEFLRSFIELFLTDGRYENPREISFHNPTVSRV
jgi:hypothetical protein